MEEIRAAKDGYTVGIALKSFDGEKNATATAMVNEQEVKTGKILVFVNLGYSKFDDGIASLAASSEVEPHYGGSTSLNWSIDQTTGRLTTNYGLDLGGNSIENVRAILSASGKWRIDENGILVTKEIKTQKLEVGSPGQPAGVTVYDEDTKTPYCIKVKSGISVTMPGACSSINQNEETATSTQ